MSSNLLEDLRNLDPLSFTREGDDVLESPPAVIILSDAGEYRGHLILEPGQRLPADVNPARAIPVINGADPGEVARWIENRGDLLEGFCTGEVPLWQVRSSLSSCVRIWHWIDDGSWAREDFEDWVGRWCPGHLLDFLVLRRGGAAQIVEARGEEFLRYREDDGGSVFYAWIPIAVVWLMERVGRESGCPKGVWKLDGAR